MAETTTQAGNESLCPQPHLPSFLAVVGQAMVVGIPLCGGILAPWIFGVIRAVGFTTARPFQAISQETYWGFIALVVGAGASLGYAGCAGWDLWRSWRKSHG